MDPEISFLFQSPSPKGITEAQVRAELSPVYDRHVLPGDKAQIETAWLSRLQQNPWLFDGTKFRLHSIKFDGDILTFHLGLTCYKDFVGTNLAEAAGQLQQKGCADWGNSQAYLAEPLGVGAMVHTADNQFVFLRRSLCVGEAPGKVDIPGGHPEPEVVAGDASEGPLCHHNLPGELVVKELFFSVLREIQDEVNLPLTTLSSPALLGIARNETSAGRSSAEFYIRCSLTSEQVRHNYAIGGPEAQESTSIIFVSREDVLTMEQSGELWKELCPSAKGAIKLYTAVMGCGIITMDTEGTSAGSPPQSLAQRDRKQGRRRRRKDQDPDTHLSKALSYALRHGAAKLGLSMGPDGFVDVAEILRLPQFKASSLADVKRVVETNDKQRFALRPHPSEGHLQIRANQGHSLQVSELELTPLLDPADFPETVAHGTYLRHWPRIRQSGLSRMGRTHIHFAPGLPEDGAVLSGMRRDCEVAVIIDVARALGDGIAFYRSANGVILTPGDANGMLPPRYFQEVLQLQPMNLISKKKQMDFIIKSHVELYSVILTMSTQKVLAAP